MTGPELRRRFGRSPPSAFGRACAGLLAAALLAVACGSTSGHASGAFACPTGTSPCGDGCIPSDGGVCCDNGAGTTSSYCTNAAGGGCFANAAGACAAAFPSGTTAQFCCSQNATAGSNDCPAGQHHCGLECMPADHACCPPGSSGSECPELRWDPSVCTLEHPNDVGCAVCLTTSVCSSCPAGACCKGDPCAGGGCAVSPVCGTASAVSGTGGGTCPGGLLVSTLECDPLGSSGANDQCVSAAEYMTATGNPLPAACAPQGTTGCLATTGTLAGTLVAPCCPGLTCRVGSGCGDPTSAVGGTCLP
jgi:hypothetical protein